MKRSPHEQLSTVLILLARAAVGMTDRFMVQKVHYDMAALISAHTRLSKGSGNVAQYFWEMRGVFENLIRTLEYCSHFMISNPLPLANAQRASYQLYDMFLKDYRKQPAARGRSDDLSAPVAPRNQKVKKTKKPIASPLTDNQEKILSFIKASPDSRTKDIIDEFSTLSNRTVKRNLRELIDAGLVTRRAENKAAFYSVGPKGLS